MEVQQKAGVGVLRGPPMQARSPRRWEEGQRREAASQSDQTERRDAGVQVDLLTQLGSWKHSGMCAQSWRCVCVRAKQPGGGALLHRDGDGGSAFYLLCPALLPTIPLLSLAEAKEILSSCSSATLAPPASPAPPSPPPCMPQCGTSPTAGNGSGATPPATSAQISPAASGLIAPVSPELSDEEEKVKELIIQNAKKMEGRSSEGGGVGPLVKEEGRTPRPRRNKVGPPVRYLLESEDRSHGLAPANHSRVVGAKMRRSPEERKEEQQHEKRSRWANEKGQEDAPWTDGQQVCCGVSVEEEGGGKVEAKECAERPRRKMVGPPIRYLIESEQPSHAPILTNQDVANKHKQNGRQLKKVVSQSKDKGGASLMIDAFETKGRQVGKVTLEGWLGHVTSEKFTEQPQRPRRKMVGPPIRYLLESEVMSHDVTTNQHSASADHKQTETKDVCKTETGDRASETRTDKLGPTSLIYEDHQSSHVTHIAPCCVSLQRLLPAHLL